MEHPTSGAIPSSSLTADAATETRNFSRAIKSQPSSSTRASRPVKRQKKKRQATREDHIGMLRPASVAWRRRERPPCRRREAPIGCGSSARTGGTTARQRPARRCPPWRRFIFFLKKKSSRSTALLFHGVVFDRRFARQVRPGGASQKIYRAGG